MPWRLPQDAPTSCKSWRSSDEGRNSTEDTHGLGPICPWSMIYADQTPKGLACGPGGNSPGVCGCRHVQAHEEVCVCVRVRACAGVGVYVYVRSALLTGKTQMLQ